jgi:hypothetical protein
VVVVAEVVVAVVVAMTMAMMMAIMMLTLVTQPVIQCVHLSRIHPSPQSITRILKNPIITGRQDVP